MTIDDYMKKINNKNKTKEPGTYKKNLIKRTLAATTIVLILLIICNLSTKPKKTLKKYICETNYNVSKINKLYKK